MSHSPFRQKANNVDFPSFPAPFITVRYVPAPAPVLADRPRAAAFLGVDSDGKHCSSEILHNADRHFHYSDKFWVRTAPRTFRQSSPNLPLAKAGNAGSGSGISGAEARPGVPVGVGSVECRAGPDLDLDQTTLRSTNGTGDERA